MVRKLREVRSGVFAVQSFERLDRLPVQPVASGSREPFVDRVADENVCEAESTRPSRNVGKDASRQCFVESFE
jgi:hypothetical protein